MAFAQISALPDMVLIQTDEEWARMAGHSAGRWVYRDTELWINESEGVIEAELSARSTPVKRVIVKWKQPVGNKVRILGDHWERGYGDLEWRGIVSSDK